MTENTDTMPLSVEVQLALGLHAGSRIQLVGPKSVTVRPVEEDDLAPLSRDRRSFLKIAAAAVTGTVTGAVFGAPTALFNVRLLGAKGDGQTLDTLALQAAIDAAAKHAPATVHVPAGRYVTGTLLLKSGVTFDLAPDATLLGSLNSADYRLVEPFTDAVGTARGYTLLGCVDATGVTISGGGTIDGRGLELQHAAGTEAGKTPAARPFLVLCVRSSSIQIQNVKLLNSAAWTTHIFQCTDVKVTGVTLRSLGLPNNDGIDIDSSSNVRIERCTIDTGDDAICLKTTSATPTTGVTVTDCTLTTRCAAFKIGTESLADFRDIRLADCHVVRANLGAVKLLSVDGANIANVTVERLTVDDADTPIFLRLGARGRTFRAGDKPRPPGTLSDITLRDITVARATRIGILISGIPGHTLDNVTLQRIGISMSGAPSATAAPPEPAEMPAAYPEVRMFGADLPASGIYARHARNLRLAQVRIVAIPNDPRPLQLATDGSFTMDAP